MSRRPRRLDGRLRERLGREERSQDPDAPRRGGRLGIEGERLDREEEPEDRRARPLRGRRGSDDVELLARKQIAQNFAC
jgi:hypothetical protein